MALAKENARTSAYRAYIDKTVSLGVSLISPTMNVALGGLTADLGKAGDVSAFRNVKWGVGGSSFDWRHKKYRSKATTDTGQFGVRDYSEPDLHANPSVSLNYMHHQTWAVGEGDLNKNRHAGPQKILDLKRERMDDAAEAIQSEMALQWWNINETSHNGGLSMFSPTNHGASTTYAGIALDASTTNGTDTFYYWKCTGYDYGTKTFGANFVEIVGALISQMRASSKAGGGGRIQTPDFGACDPTLWPYILLYYDTKASFNIDKAANPNFLEQGFPNIKVQGVTIFADDNFGGSTGYVDGSATEELLLGNSKQMFLATTNTEGEGLVTSHATDKGDQAWLRGLAGVFKTGNQAIGVYDPRQFQILYT